jgi:hypothetical protein
MHPLHCFADYPRYASTPATVYGRDSRVYRVMQENALTVGQLNHQADTLTVGYQCINPVNTPV